MRRRVVRQFFLAGVPYLKIAWRTWPLALALTVAVIIVGFVPWLSLWFR